MQIKTLVQYNLSIRIDYVRMIDNTQSWQECGQTGISLTFFGKNCHELFGELFGNVY